MKSEILFAVFLISAFSLVVVFSEADATSNTFADELACRINFNIAVLNSFISVNSNNSASLQSSVTTLNNDLTQLQSLNSSSYRSFDLQYANDMMNVRQSVQQWRASTLEGLSMNTKGVLVTSYNSSLAAFQQCESTVVSEMAQGRINSYQTQIANFQNASNKLASRGFNTSSLNTLLQNAQIQIIQPIQTAIATNNSTQVNLALRTYCMYDGCVNGTNFHLDAKFDLSRLTIVYNDLSNNSVAFNLNTSVLSEANGNITDANNVLTQVGISAYASGQSQQIFSDIKNASQAISQLITQVNKELGMGLK